MNIILKYYEFTFKLILYIAFTKSHLKYTEINYLHINN